MSIKVASKDMWGDNGIFNIINVSEYPHTMKFKMLRKNIINTDSVGAIIGTILICLCLPSQSTLHSEGRRILPIILQGNLLKVLIAMDYDIGDDIKIISSV